MNKNKGKKKKSEKDSQSGSSNMNLDHDLSDIKAASDDHKSYPDEDKNIENSQLSQNQSN